ncbi:glycosylphosphatidylinositol anchor attachment 1 protein-like [Limulus polyphemus]|uniref:Glycosylphosphatidylinositol anchor attachment 1 protein-like n=1 Tax=Limulus polyphemus TaxID=6850 RepID=A0ABM1BX65_LIMPO|nr:glycosylphosphatidylinositol anchor attachment 1 protein-like [Limulus polyphemus]
MGLLTDTKEHSKLIILFKQHGNKLCFLSYVVGIVWFCLLAWEPYNNRTYFSENALLPGLVQREFSPGHETSRFFQSLKEEAGSHARIPYAWLGAQFRQMGLDVYDHNYTLHYPFGSKPNFTGKNLYAILRAPRAASTEAILLSVPYRTPENQHGSTLPGIALMLSLAKFFRRQLYWAKDIIFLVTEHELVGFQAWLDAYHNSKTAPGVLDSGELEGRSGAIQAAINLEIHSDKISHFDVKIEGQNGQLPNLDLFNLVVELSTRESVPSTFHQKSNPVESESWKGWKQAFSTLMSMVALQATGLPTGGHGLFHRYAIQALTIKGESNGPGGIRASFVHMGRVIEGVFRSLNNLLERFHQSFFFYLLPSTRRYVSIGLYMPAFGLIAAPLLIKALNLYLSLQSSKDLDKKATPGMENKDEDAREETFPSLWQALPLVFSSHILGCLVYLSPEYFDRIGMLADFQLEDGIFMGMAALLLAVLVVPLFSRRLKRCGGSHGIYRCIVLLELGAFFYTLSLINVSLATFLAVVYVPVAVLAGTSSRRIFTWVHSLLLLLIHPLMLVYLVLLVNSAYLDTSTKMVDHMFRAYTGVKKVVLYSVEDWYIYSNWNFVIASGVLLPVWLQLWFLPTL